jgi:hypothetical protein
MAKSARQRTPQAQSRGTFGSSVLSVPLHECRGFEAVEWRSWGRVTEEDVEPGLVAGAVTRSARHFVAKVRSVLYFG